MAFVDAFRSCAERIFGVSESETFEVVEQRLAFDPGDEAVHFEVRVRTGDGRMYRILAEEELFHAETFAATPADESVRALATRFQLDTRTVHEMLQEAGLLDEGGDAV